MKFPLLVPMLLLLAACPAHGKPAPAADAAEAVAERASFTVPDGFARTEKFEQGDPQVWLERDLHRIKIRLAGGEGSRYKDPAAFLDGFEARSCDGGAAEKVGSAKVAGAERPVYERRVAVTLPPPGTGGPATTAAEQFCLVPVGKRFFLLSYAYGDSIPDPSYDGGSAWRAFLKSFRLK